MPDVVPMSEYKGKLHTITLNNSDGTCGLNKGDTLHYDLGEIPKHGDLTIVERAEEQKYVIWKFQRCLNLVAVDGERVKNKVPFAIIGVVRYTTKSTNAD